MSRNSAAENRQERQTLDLVVTWSRPFRLRREAISTTVATLNKPCPECRFHILAIGYDAKARERTREYLARAGFRVSVYGTTTRLECVVAALEPNLLLLNVLLPGFRSIDLERVLQHYPVACSSPVVLQSPLPAARLRKLLPTAGALGVVGDCEEPTEFVHCIRHFAETIDIRERLRDRPHPAYRLSGSTGLVVPIFPNNRRS